MKNLRVIMADKDISITDLSEELNISRNTLTSYYYNRNKNIKVNYMIQIADYFDVTLDELFGRMSYSTADTIGRNIKKIRLDRELTMEQLASKVSSDKSNVSRWERGVNKPNDLTLIKLANLADITVDELLN